MLFYRCTELILPERGLGCSNNNNNNKSFIIVRNKLLKQEMVVLTPRDGEQLQWAWQLQLIVGKVVPSSALRKSADHWLSKSVFQERGSPAFSKVHVLVCFSFAVMNTVAGSNLGSKEYVWLTGCSSSREAWARTPEQEEPRGRNWNRNSGRMMLIGLLFLAISQLPLLYNPAMAPTSVKNEENAPQTWRQVSLMEAAPQRNALFPDEP